MGKGGKIEEKTWVNKSKKREKDGKKGKWENVGKM